MSYAGTRRQGEPATRKDTGRARVPHPSVAWGDTSPYRGGFIGRQSPKASPARGGGCAARRRRRGALPLCPTGIPQTPAGPCPASVGDDARIVPQTLRCRKPQAAGENARPTLRPGTGDNAEEAAPRQVRRRADASIGPYAGVASGRGHAAACRPRFCHLFTLYCRAGVHARRGPCPTGIPQTPAGPCPASVGDDACIVPQTL